MLLPIVLLLIAIVVFAISMPAKMFLAGFGALLVAPVSKRGLWRYLRGVEEVGGQFEGREVVLVLHHRRLEHTLGYLVASMKSTRPPVSAVVTAAVLRTRVTGPRGRDALDQLEVVDELRVTFEGGWLKATWMPIGFIIFPGRFDKMRWNNVLRAMRDVVVSLEE